MTARFARGREIAGEAGAAYKARAKRGRKHATMLAAVVAAAAVLGDETFEEGGCDIPNYHWRVYESGIALPGVSHTFCCNSSDLQQVYDNCYTATDVCDVQIPSHRCCGVPSMAGDSTWCGSENETECKELISSPSNPTNNTKWCEAPAPPADDSGLSAGATAGIVVAGILGPFALGLAYKTLA